MPLYRPHETAATWSRRGSTEMIERVRIQVRSNRAAPPRPGDGCRPGAAIGLDDVAIDRHLTLAHGRQVRDGPEGPADQPLDFLRSTRRLPGTNLAAGAFVRRTREHGVLRRDPASPARSAQPRGRTLFERRGAEHPGISEADEARAFCVARNRALQAHGPQLVGGTLGRPHRGPLLSRVSRAGLLGRRDITASIAVRIDPRGSVAHDRTTG